LFTWSFGCTPSPAMLAITSFAFMFDEVPEPVWKTSIGNWSSCSPSATSSPARAMRSAMSASSSPSSALTRADAALIRPSQCSTGAGTCSPDTGKFFTAFEVSTPQSSCRIAMALRLSTPPSRSDPAPVGGAVAAEALTLLLEPAQQLASLTALLAGAAAGRSDQITELELGGTPWMSPGGCGEPGRRIDETATHGLELARFARAGHAGGEAGAVHAYDTGRGAQGVAHGVGAQGAGG